MRAKLSWMVFAIIGGVIVSGVLIFVYFFMINGVIFSEISMGSIKSWSKLVGGLTEAKISQSTVVPMFSVEHHIIHADACDPQVPQCKSRYDNYYKEIREGDIILILPKTTLVNSGIKDRVSRAAISSCTGKYCYCAAHIKLDDGVMYYWGYWTKPIATGYYESAIPSIIYSSNILDNLLQYSKVTIFSCKGFDKPLVYDGKNVTGIQFFETRALFIHYTKTGFVITFIDPSDCDFSNCVLTSTYVLK